MATFWKGFRADYRDVAKARRANKYYAERAPCDLGGVAHMHDSLKERERHFILAQREAAGEIGRLRWHRRWPLRVNGQVVGTYVDDFSYLERGQLTVEDVKSPATRRLPLYRLKRRLMAACWGIAIREV